MPKEERATGVEVGERNSRLNAEIARALASQTEVRNLIGEVNDVFGFDGNLAFGDEPWVSTARGEAPEGEIGQPVEVLIETHGNSVKVAEYQVIVPDEQDAYLTRRLSIKFLDKNGRLGVSVGLEHWRHGDVKPSGIQRKAHPLVPAFLEKVVDSKPFRVTKLHATKVASED